MAEERFNEVLAQARQQKGYDLTTVARRLRIRPDILRAIESGDFSAMPPRGYTRNMVNAYARLLGLNPTEIVNLYLDEAYDVQRQRARRNAPGSGFDMSEANRRSRRPVYGSRVDEDSEPVSSRSRDLYDDRTRFSRDDYGTKRTNAQRSDRSERDFLSHHSGYPSSEFRFDDDYDRRGTRRRGVTVGTTPMRYTASRLPSFLQSRPTLIILGVVVIAVIILILVLALGNGGSQEEEVGQLPITGIADTTGTADEDAEEAAQAKVQIAPTAARVAYAATSDEGCYVQFYEDGELKSEKMLDKTEETIDVTGVLLIATYTPDFLDLTVDGEKVELKSDSEYGGMYTYTVDFPAILEAWEQDHPDSKASRRATAADTATNPVTGGSDTTEPEDEYEDAYTWSDSSNDQDSADSGYDDYYDDGTGYDYYDDGTGTY